jgi:hypothetical protein
MEIGAPGCDVKIFGICTLYMMLQAHHMNEIARDKLTK